MPMQPGARVIVRPDKKGQVIVVIDGGKGKAKHFPIGTWYGVRLVEKRGVTDGRYKAQDPYFFKCPMGFGVFVQAKDVVKVIADDFNFMDEQKEIEAAKEKENEKYKAQRSKILQLKAAFKKTDTDGSQSLEEKEFIELATEQLGCDNTEASKLFRTIDASGNGSVSFAEFDSWCKSGGGIDKLLQYKALRQAFQDADKDGNLSLSLDEFIELAAKAMDLDKTAATKLFKRIDVNENGDVSFAEFEAYTDDLGGIDNFKVYAQIIEAFKAADKDKSGGLDVKEFAKLVKEKLKLNKYKAAKIFASIDVDKNETVSVDEFETWVAKIGGVKKIQKK